MQHCFNVGELSVAHSTLGRRSRFVDYRTAPYSGLRLHRLLELLQVRERLAADLSKLELTFCMSVSAMGVDETLSKAVALGLGRASAPSIPAAPP